MVITKKINDLGDVYTNPFKTKSTYQYQYIWKSISIEEINEYVVMTNSHIIQVPNIIAINTRLLSKVCNKL